MQRRRYATGINTRYERTTRIANTARGLSHHVSFVEGRAGGDAAIWGSTYEARAENGIARCSSCLNFEDTDEPGSILSAAAALYGDGTILAGMKPIPPLSITVQKFREFLAPLRVPSIVRGSASGGVGNECVYVILNQSSLLAVQAWTKRPCCVGLE